jgi:undecaprenyl-diphosphatase
MTWFEALVLGLVQGLTEFLPVSSDGHLTVFQMLFEGVTGRTRSGKDDLFFDIMLHLGTLGAIAVHYRRVALAGARGLLGAKDVPDLYRRGPLVRLGVLVFVALLPLVPYFKIKYIIEDAIKSPVVTGLGFLVTAAALLVTLRLPGGQKGPSEITWRDALLIGIAQAFAPLPGVSRSGLTIAMALALGLTRSWAVQFSFLIGVPAILGATVVALKDVDRSSLTPDRIAQTVAAAVLAGLLGYLAIVWLVRIVRSGRLWYFSVYLILLGTAVLAGGLVAGGRPDGGRSPALDRPARGATGGQGPGSGPGRAGQPLDRTDPTGRGAGHTASGVAPAHRDPA